MEVANERSHDTCRNLSVMQSCGVDSTYRSELKELNELNFARFDAKLEQRIAELRAELRTEIHGLKAELIKWMFLFWAGTALAGLLLH
jgi:hypothetical protein